MPMQSVRSDVRPAVEMFRPGSCNGEFDGLREFTFMARVNGRIGAGTITVTATTWEDVDERRAAAAFGRALREGTVVVEPID